MIGVPRKDAVAYGLVTLVAVALVVIANLMPVTRADVFDSPLPSPGAYLPFVASDTFESPLAPPSVYLPFVTHNAPRAP